jgi:type IVB pilus formation R64 PilN family outer membrane protein
MKVSLMKSTQHISGLSVIASAALLLCSLSGCSTVQQASAANSATARSINAEQDKADAPVPVITKSKASFLLGQSVQVQPTPSPLLMQNVTYHPSQKVTLTDVGSWISSTTGLLVDTAEVGVPSSAVSSGALNSMSGMPSPMGLAGSSSASANALASHLFPVSFQGPLSGLLDVVANKAGVWWKFTDGRLMFFKSETKTFYLPAIARKSTGSSVISASAGNSSGGGSSSGGAGASSGSGNSSSSSGAASSTSEYSIDVWGDLEKTAKTVAGGAQVVANASLGSITVTGTPSQVRNIEEWAKGLTDTLSQQVAITVEMYTVSLTSDDTYNWNPNVIFKNMSTKYGLALTGPQSPATTSGLAPLSMIANVAAGATGKLGQYSGSQLAYQAISSLGNVSSTMRRTVLTQNGQPSPFQIANQTFYLASSTQATAAVGTVPQGPSLTPGTVTTGLTGMFLPRIVNGKILLSVNLTNSSLISLGTVSSGGSSIQTPNIDTSTFQQSVTLTPGDSVLLTGLQQSSSKNNNSGVGSPTNFLLGGGVDSAVGKNMTAIVITAKVL